MCPSRLYRQARQAGELRYGERSAAGEKWREGQKERVWKGQVKRVMEGMKPTEEMSEEERAGLERERGYFGRGVLESACREYVSQRVKGSGMQWKGGLNPVLAL